MKTTEAQFRSSERLFALLAVKDLVNCPDLPEDYLPRNIMLFFNKVCKAHSIPILVCRMLLKDGAVAVDEDFGVYTL
jgi:hypothetical protein